MSDENMPHTEKLARRVLGLGWSRMVEPLPQIVGEAIRLIEEDRNEATAALRSALAASSAREAEARAMADQWRAALDRAVDVEAERRDALCEREQRASAAESRALAAEREKAEAEQALAKVFAICLPITGTADSTTVGMVRSLTHKLAAAERTVEAARAEVERLYSCNLNGLGPCLDCRAAMDRLRAALSPSTGARFVAEIPPGSQVAAVPGVGILAVRPDLPPTLNGKPLSPSTGGAAPPILTREQLENLIRNLANPGCSREWITDSLRRLLADVEREGAASGESAGAELCAGCDVRPPFEHRCHGAPCPCSECREADALFDSAAPSVEAPEHEDITAALRKFGGLLNLARFGLTAPVPKVHTDLVPAPSGLEERVKDGIEYALLHLRGGGNPWCGAGEHLAVFLCINDVVARLRSLLSPAPSGPQANERKE